MVTEKGRVHDEGEIVSLTSEFQTMTTRPPVRSRVSRAVAGLFSRVLISFDEAGAEAGSRA